MKSAVARFANYLRQFVPAPLLPLIVLIRARIARHRRAAWVDAQQQMRWVVGDDESQETIERLALGHLESAIWRGQVRGHPQLVTRQPLVGVEHLRAASKDDKGVLFCFAHHADYEGLPASLAWAGFPSHLVSTSGLFAEKMPIWMQYSKRILRAEGAELLDVARGSKGIKEVLARGGAVSLAVDVPGRTPATFLGHSVQIATGAARIAIEMQVPVVVVTSRRRGGKSRMGAQLKVLEPMYPQEFDSHKTLLNAILQPLEQSIRAWPEAWETPGRRFDPAILGGT